MALIGCPECRKEVSSKAKACPHCGYADSTRRNLLWMFYGSVVAGLLVFIDANTFATWPLYMQHRHMVGIDNYVIPYWMIQAGVLIAASVGLVVSSVSLLFVRIRSYIRG